MKIKISFINNGKPFIIPKWTVKKHRAALAQLSNDYPTVTDAEDKAFLFNACVIFQTLKQVDPSVNIEDIIDIHPENLNKLFDAVYTAGKEDVFFEEGEKPKSENKKSTGKKS